jgi:hypothetical protein
LPYVIKGAEQFDAVVDSLAIAVDEHTERIEAELQLLDREASRMKYLVTEMKKYPRGSAEYERFRSDYVVELKTHLARQRMALGGRSGFQVFLDSTLDARSAMKGVTNYGWGYATSGLAGELAKALRVREAIRWVHPSNPGPYDRSMDKALWRNLDRQGRRLGSYMEKVAGQALKLPQASLVSGRMTDTGWLDLGFSQYSDCYRTSLILTMPSDKIRPVTAASLLPLYKGLVAAPVAEAAPIITAVMPIPALAVSAIPSAPPPRYVDWEDQSPQRSQDSSEPAPPQAKGGLDLGNTCRSACGQAHVIDKSKVWHNQ